TVTQESFKWQYYVTRALLGARTLFAMTAPLGSVAFHALLAATVEKCSTFPEAMHASANQIAFHANTTAQALANQTASMLTSKEREAPKKKEGGPNSVD